MQTGERARVSSQALKTVDGRRRPNTFSLRAVDSDDSDTEETKELKKELVKVHLMIYLNALKMNYHFRYRRCKSRHRMPVFYPIGAPLREIST